MARIPEAELQHLKAAVSLVAVVQAQGDNWLKGRTSPRCVRSMTRKRRPVISPEKNLYHCFGCNAGGSVLNW